MRACGGGRPMWLFFTLVCTTIFSGTLSCRVNEYVFSCVLDILEEHITANARVNYCHLPVDVTFLVDYHYGNSKTHYWKYTFVTTNQNERVLIPGLQFPTAPHAPVFLYVRVPERDFSLHNASFVSIEASFVAELENKEWEEAEFINHTIFIKSTDDCRFSPTGQDPIPWIIGCFFAIMLVCGGIGGGCYVYRRKMMAADQLALVNAMEVGLPGAQPYQMGAMESKSDGTGSEPEKKPDNEGNEAKENKDTPKLEEPEEEPRGKKGFKFNRLKEEKNEMSKNYGRGIDNSVIIGNPAYLEEIEKVQKRMSSRDERTSADEVDHRNSNGLKNAVSVNGKVSSQSVRQTISGEECHENEVTNDEPKVSLEEMDPSQHSDDSLDSNLQVGQGARPKVRGVSSSITGPPSVAGDASDANVDSPKCL